VVIAGVAFVFLGRTTKSHNSTGQREERLVPVESAEIQHGPLAFSRTFSGTIKAHAQFDVAPKISGRIERLLTDVSETVVRGQIVVEMESAEFEQQVIEAEARLAVAQANRDEAVSRFKIASRQLDRAKTLSNRGIASESAYDTAQEQFLTGQSAVKVAEANLKREEALLRAAKIRLGYTRVKANWKQGDSKRIVAERFIDEGNTVAANTPIFSIVEIDPVIATIQLNERDYPRISLGQQAQVQVDGFSDQVFTGVVSRISPVFQESSRQAEIEIQVANTDLLLKPGMFARCRLELDSLENAVSVPEMAITKRNNQLGVFLIDDERHSVKWVEVKPGFKSGDQVQLLEPDLTGHVVTLGQQFIKDGSRVKITKESIMADGSTEVR